MQTFKFRCRKLYNCRKSQNNNAFFCQIALDGSNGFMVVKCFDKDIVDKLNVIDKFESYRFDLTFYLKQQVYNGKSEIIGVLTDFDMIDITTSEYMTVSENKVIKNEVVFPKERMYN